MNIIFKRGLKENIKDKLIRDYRSYKNLTEIIETAIKLNNKLYKRVIEKRYNGEPISSAGRYSRRPFGRYNSSKPKKSGGSYFGLLIELDSI